jgi:phosphoacetylglucosamine mutase
VKEGLAVEMVNADTTTRGKLNFECGADFVKLYQRAPLGMMLEIGERSCSLDGDADRIVFYYKDRGQV